MKKILLLAGGASNEREVSLRSGSAVQKALESGGYVVFSVDPSDKAFDLSDYPQKVDCAFIALHGTGGEDGTIQAELEKAGIPYIGSKVDASKLCWNKWDYKKLLRTNNLPVSEGKLVTKEHLTRQVFEKPFVLKPIKGGSTLDTIIARQVNERNMKLAKFYLSRYPTMLLEPLILGREITVAVLANEALPVIEIIPPENKEFDYENKYNGATQELTGTLSLVEEKKAQELALKAHKITDCRDISRTDMIIDINGRFHILETNTIPGLTETSLLPKAAKATGMDMVQVVDLLVQSASLN